MGHILVDVLEQMTSLSEEERVAIATSFPIKVFAEGSYLLKAGQVAQSAYYVVKGCIREYELSDGEEKTTAFFTENESVANFHSLANGVPSKQYLICMEDTTVAILNAEKEKALYIQYPRFETFCRTGMEKMMGEKQSQLVDFISLKPQARYQKLQAERPDLLNRVPQYHIASYLGVQPETLSRIRKKLLKS